jgi:hypothetical protein
METKYMANYQILEFDLSAGATTTSWKRMLSLNSGNTRAVTGTLTSGDSIVVQFTNETLDPNKEIITTEVSANGNVAESNSQTTTTFNFGYDGNFKWARVVKTGSNGAAKVSIEC